MKTSSLAAALLAGVSVAAAADAATIRVPADAATIQQAIDASAAGDTVLVSPGTYVENINYRGKTIRLVSEQGPAVTIIDGNRAGSVVTFASGENRNAVLEGFTVRNGANGFSGGGVLIQNSSPTIIGNSIVGNGACSAPASTATSVRPTVSPLCAPTPPATARRRRRPVIVARN